MPASRMALAVPPVERRWTFLEWRNLARGRRLDLSETDRRARVMGTTSVVLPVVHDLQMCEHVAY